MTVTEQGALLQTEDANISSNFDTNQIQNIPNPGGDITYVAQTAPGVTMNNSTGGGYGNFSAFGLPGTSNLFTVNGNDYNDAFLNLNNSGSSNLLLGGNELQEVAVVSNGYTGQYGRQAGAQIDYTHEIRQQRFSRRLRSTTGPAGRSPPTIPSTKLRRHAGHLKTTTSGRLLSAVRS